MQLFKKTTLVASCQILLAAIAAAPAFAQVQAAVPPSSPFTSFTAGVAIYLLLTAFLVAVLLVGGFLIVNIGMMSKRPMDRVGGRTPSDVGILKYNVWPEVPVETRILPAEEEDVTEYEVREYQVGREAEWALPERKERLEDFSRALERGEVLAEEVEPESELLSEQRKPKKAA